MTRASKLAHMAQSKAGKPSLSLPDADRVLKVLKRLYLERFGGNKSELARALGRSQPAVTQLLDGTNLPSLDTARRVARLEGVDVTTYLDEHAPETPSTEPFPSRWRAAQSARWLLFDEWAIEQMLAEDPRRGSSQIPVRCSGFVASSSFSPAPAQLQIRGRAPL